MVNLGNEQQNQKEQSEKREKNKQSKPDVNDEAKVDDKKHEQQQQPVEQRNSEHSPVFTYDEHSSLLGAVGGGNETDVLSTAVDNQRDEEAAQSNEKPFPPHRLARISQAKKLRKTRLSLSKFLEPEKSSANVHSSNSSEASSYGSVPSDFDDVCNNN